MSIIKAIDKAFKTKEERGWTELYYFIDIHNTVLYPDYTNNQPLVFYKHAKEVLQYLSTRNDIVLCLYTCSHQHEIVKYLQYFRDHNIDFKYVNRNPDAKNTTYGNYEDKPYFNVLFEDKAGFDAETDWELVKQYFNI